MTAVTLRPPDDPEKRKPLGGAASRTANFDNGDSNNTLAPAGAQACDIIEAHAARHSGRRNKLRPNSKRAGVLRALLERGPRGLNCFEAVRECHDYVLRSTISDLTRGYGFEFYRRDEQVPGFGRNLVQCVRYSFTPEDEALARDLLPDVGAT